MIKGMAKDVSSTNDTSKKAEPMASHGVALDKVAHGKVTRDKVIRQIFTCDMFARIDRQTRF